LKQLDLISDNYRYKFSLNNIVDEICPIYFAISDENIEINKQEISEVFLKWSEFNLYLEQNLNDFTPWCKEEIKLLENSKIFKIFMDSQWGHSSVGRAFEWHSKGRRFDSAWLHHFIKTFSKALV
jgi:isopentenyldiphosphate isomerase